MLALAGEAIALLLSAVAVGYLWQRALLKRRSLEQLRRRQFAMPLNQWERALLVCLWAGFLCLTFSFISGVYYKPALLQFSASTSLKSYWAIAVWIWYGLALVLRYGLGLSTRGIAYMCLMGLALLASAFFGFIFMPTARIL